MYTVPFTVPQIIKNFYNYRDIYGIEENFGGGNIIVNPSLTNI